MRISGLFTPKPAAQPPAQEWILPHGRDSQLLVVPDAQIEVVATKEQDEEIVERIAGSFVADAYFPEPVRNVAFVSERTAAAGIELWSSLAAAANTPGLFESIAEPVALNPHDQETPTEFGQRISDASDIKTESSVPECSGGKADILKFVEGLGGFVIASVSIKHGGGRFVFYPKIREGGGAGLRPDFELVTPRGGYRRQNGTQSMSGEWQESTRHFFPETFSPDLFESVTFGHIHGHQCPDCRF